MKNGPYGPIVGKIGNTVGYIRLGQPVIRMVKHATNKPPTEAQLAARARFKLVSGFISLVNVFTNVGFKPKAKTTIGKTAQNMAVSANLNTAVTGNYPDYALDYSKVVLSEGKLPFPKDCSVQFTGTALKFTWDSSKILGFPRSLDQVMMLAYFPETKKVRMLPGGAGRNAGEDVLDLEFETVRPRTETYLEAYMGFISNDREEVSDSLYMGRIMLDEA